MFKKVADFYMSKNRRERIMLAVIVWTLAIFWASQLSEKSSVLNDEIKTLQTKKETLQTVIAQAGTVQEMLEKVKAVFDVKKTVSPEGLQLFVESCAKNAGLAYSMSSVVNKGADKFNLHIINLSANGARLNNVVNFERSLREKEPYITLQRVSFEGSKDGTVDVRYAIASFSALK